MPTNIGFSVTTTIPLDGIVEIDIAWLAESGADIVAVEIAGGGTLRGVRLVENGSPLEPSSPLWFTAIWISAAPGDLVTVSHLSGLAAAGEKIDTVLGVDAIIDSHDHIGRYVWHEASETWRLKLNCWTAA